MRLKPKVKSIRKLSLVTLASVYILILAGGIVRSTGSGMGCPDWPKCFGSWIPPTEVDQLPSGYKDIYAQQREEKNVKFTSYLEFFGFIDLADQIRKDKSILVEEDFNAAKTWTEYINRLIGAVVGLFILITFLLSFTYLGYDNKVFFISLITLFAVGLQGWIGSVVVSTNLLQWMITLHMLLALVIVALLTYSYLRVRKDRWMFHQEIAPSPSIKIVLTVLMVLSLVQIMMGTQVRESVDMVADTFNHSQRESWIDELGIVFYIHRSFSLLLLLAHLYLVYRVLYFYGNQGNLMIDSLVLMIVIVVEVSSGAIMAWFAIPRIAQPIHLVFASIAFGLQFYIWVKVRQMSAFLVRVPHRSKGVKKDANYQVYS